MVLEQGESLLVSSKGLELWQIIIELLLLKVFVFHETTAVI